MSSCSVVCVSVCIQAGNHSASCSTQLGWLPPSAGLTFPLRCSQGLCHCSWREWGPHDCIWGFISVGTGQRLGHLEVDAPKEPEAACSLLPQACRLRDALSDLWQLLSVEGGQRAEAAWGPSAWCTGFGQASGPSEECDCFGVTAPPSRAWCNHVGLVMSCGGFVF